MHSALPGARCDNQEGDLWIGTPLHSIDDIVASDNLVKREFTDQKTSMRSEQNYGQNFNRNYLHAATCGNFPQSNSLVVRASGQPLPGRIAAQAGHSICVPDIFQANGRGEGLQITRIGQLGQERLDIQSRLWCNEKEYKIQ